MDFSDILSSLSAEDMKNLQNIAASLAGSAQPDAGNAAKQPPPPASGGIDPKTVSNIASVMSKLNGAGSDPRCQLISALKPMLSPERRQRADEAIRILKLIDLIPVLKDSGLLKGVIGL
ncbi:MAG: hypothetical protein ACI4GA_08280 [Acutalibacteraceae bacterium]|nr:hypothetical protein [Oscillospiraceae bacterium]